MDYLRDYLFCSDRPTGIGVRGLRHSTKQSFIGSGIIEPHYTAVASTRTSDAATESVSKRVSGP